MTYPEDYLNKIINGDCLEVLKTFPNNSIDAIVTDPPAGIAFMGKEWDNFATRGRGNTKDGKHPKGFAGDVHWDKSKEARNGFIEFMTEAFTEGLRVLKPGGHALVWALPRTSHWTGTALENAGFEVRDCVYHLFGSGFPKSLDISKAIERGREVESRKAHNLEIGGANPPPASNEWENNKYGGGNSKCEVCGKWLISGNPCKCPKPEKVYKYPEAKQWEGWGTALKPAVECWWLVRKPLSENTIAENVLRHGTGGLNINATRVGLQGSDLSDKICICQENHIQSNAKNVGDQKSASKHLFKSSVQESADTLGLEKTPGIQPENISISDTLCLDEMSEENTNINLNISGSGKKKTGKNQKDMKSITLTELKTTTESKICNSCGLPITEVLPIQEKNEDIMLEKSGRFPSNLIHDGSDVILAEFPNTETHGGGTGSGNTADWGLKSQVVNNIQNDSGSAARFFYTAKPSSAEKNMLYGEFEETYLDDGREIGSAGGSNPRNRGAQTPRKNFHPTVKAQSLMQYLIKLITPPKGIVLDPFCGSGSTLLAAKSMGHPYIGIEIDKEYVAIAEARLKQGVLNF